MTRDISIIGLGWLGGPLAKQLAASGYRVRGSVTNVAACAVSGISGVVSSQRPAPP